jgi:hypothetical protein
VSTYQNDLVVVRLLEDFQLLVVEQVQIVLARSLVIIVALGSKFK